MNGYKPLLIARKSYPKGLIVQRPKAEKQGRGANSAAHHGLCRSL